MRGSGRAGGCPPRARRRGDGGVRRLRRRSRAISLDDLVKVLQREAHSRMPVYRGNLDEAPRMRALIKRLR